MSGANREEAQITDPDSDFIDAPPLDEDEPAEIAWLRAREHDPGAPAPSPAIARDYAELEDLLESLPVRSSGESWQDEVIRLVDAPSAPPPQPRTRQRRLRIAAGALAAVAAAAAATMVLWPRPSSPAGELELEIRHGEQVRGDATAAAVGDRLVVRARTLEGGEVRVYRADGALVGRCPAGPGCTPSADGGIALEVELGAPVQYHVIVVDQVTGNLSAAETMDAYLGAARAANARIQTRLIEVH